MIKSYIIHIASSTSYIVLFELGRYLALQNHNVTFLFQNNNKALLKTLQEEASKIGAHVLEYNDIEPERNFLKNRLYALLFLPFRKIKNPYEKHAKDQLAHANKILQKVSPDILIVAEDGITGNLFLIEAARRKGVIVLDCPYGFGTRYDLETDLYRKEHQEILRIASGGTGKLIKQNYPQWIKKGAYEGAIMFNPEYIIGLERAGVSLNDAWVIHGGKANRIAVESEAMMAHYLKEGIPKKKLALTGTPYCDILYNAIYMDNNRTQAFDNSTYINSNKITILVSWPPNYDLDRGHLLDFDNYEALTVDVFSFLGSLDGINVLVSLHPAVDLSVSTLINGTGCNIINGNIINHIAACDIYLTYFSSTIRWAIAAAKPVINYDFYKAELKEYDGVSSVFTVQSKEDFEKITLLLATNKQEYKKAAENQKKLSSYWGMLDGKNCERIYQISEELLLHKNKSSY